MNLNIVQVDTDFFQSVTQYLEELFFLLCVAGVVTVFDFLNLLFSQRVGLREERQVFVLLASDVVVFLDVAEVGKAVFTVKANSGGELYGVLLFAVIHVEIHGGGVALLCEAGGEVLSGEFHDSFSFRV